MTIRKRPNPAVAASERLARISEDQDQMNTNPKKSALGTIIATKRRKTADKIRTTHPYLIESE